ncbi:hypothetical protein CKO18_17470 [Rhodoferax fermentans]|uniref:Apea-like HEPN domain-containing protein n=1 Tax=Rhodoferax fermentans TaxID=28066 RepID=A0A1T1AU03_RHOFE|nr:hypothetical protein [Rhodoferax fermentans]OOV07592.1 hypothetical protein RF819_13385 [Rhodoferax fermentans]
MLHSMLVFPPVARDIDHANLIWKAVAYDPGELTKESFLKELNKQLSVELSQREEKFHVLTSVSFESQLILGKTIVENVQIQFCGSMYPRKFATSRSVQIQDQRVPATESPQNYNKIIATVTAKRPALALTAAMRAIDLHRALWCLFCNKEMEMNGRSWIPINSVRLGAIHTIHRPNGSSATEEIWFEPHNVATDPYKPKDAAKVRQRVRLTLRRLSRCPYREDIVEALLMYVRALDEWNQTTAFTRLWSAVERLSSPGYGDYDAVVRRCAFLWDDTGFATQALEHLREYRNSCVHTGGESTQAKTYCFQLQRHFRPMVLFHIGNTGRFRTLDEANEFLDMPTDLAVLTKLKQTVARVRRFRSPRPHTP